MTKQERIDMERVFAQKEREIATNLRLAIAMEQLTVVQTAIAKNTPKLAPTITPAL